MGRGTISGHPGERLELPWWLGVVLAIAGYVILKWGIPSLAGASALVAMLFLAWAAHSLFSSDRRRRALDLETSLATLRALPRERFEQFMAAAFRSEGYEVSASESRDGPVDALLTRAAERLIVQHRHWRNATIGAATLHELYGRLPRESATGCVFVTTGDYTSEARRFAAGKPVRLIAGRELERMLRLRDAAPVSAT